MYLTRCERETIVLMNEEDKTATISTLSPAMKKKLDKLYGADHSIDGMGEIYTDEKEARYEIPKSLVSFRRKRTLTPAQLEHIKEMNRMRTGRGGNMDDDE